ncbi:hypothetical protein [Isoptericola sp. NPDC019482]|uniref:hypothetical protein n=1 Tax=Isoptericola sp. NPDC019482 TaxID=3154688 RepID=UPI0034892CED
MPTTNPRTQVTHTAPVRHALDVAAKRWPGEKQSVLLTRLIEAGAESIESTAKSDSEARRRKARELAGKYEGVYGPGYLDELREGWE